MIKRPKGNGPHTVLEIPEEYDCEYYTRYGYCKLIHSHCDNSFSSISQCNALKRISEKDDVPNKKVKKKINKNNGVQLEKQIYLDLLKKCKAARISNNKELLVKFSYNLDDKNIYYEVLNERKPLKEVEIKQLLEGKTLKNEKKDFRIYGSYRKFLDRNDKTK